jgi:hypothetical protein
LGILALAFFPLGVFLLNLSLFMIVLNYLSKSS